MAEERKEYKCNRCKSSYWNSIKHEFCVCGGKLFPVQAAKELFGTIFPWIKKGEL